MQCCSHTALREQLALEFSSFEFLCYNLTKKSQTAAEVDWLECVAGNQEQLCLASPPAVPDEHMSLSFDLRWSCPSELRSLALHVFVRAVGVLYDEKTSSLTVASTRPRIGWRRTPLRQHRSACQSDGGPARSPMEEPPPAASSIGCCDRLEGASGSSLRMPSHADEDLDVNVSTLEGLQRKILTLRQGILRLFPGSPTVNADGSQVSGRRNLDRKVLYSQ